MIVNNPKGKNKTCEIHVGWLLRQSRIKEKKNKIKSTTSKGLPLVNENSQYLTNYIEERSKWIIKVIQMFGASVIDKIHPTLLALKVKDQVLKWIVAENLEAVR